jgi:hypothetical protein
MILSQMDLCKEWRCDVGCKIKLWPERLGGGYSSPHFAVRSAVRELSLYNYLDFNQHIAVM